MDTEDGQLFVKHLAHFVRTHEKALANALQLRRQQAPKNGTPQAAAGAVGGPAVPESPTVTNHTSSASSSTTSSTLAAALSLPYLNFASHNLKPAKLALTSHHLFYLLSRFEELGIPVGPMNVRLENLHAETSANYVSFLSKAQRRKGRGSDGDSMHSVSSVRSVMSGMSSLWSSFSISGGSSAAKTERQKIALEADLKYLYSAFTKIPCLRLSPDRRARLIEGYEEFPFDTAVPLYAFKNISALEISDIDIRSFFGWDRLAEQLRTLTVKRAGVEDPADLLINIVLDDMDKRRRRSSKAQMSPTTTWPAPTSPRRSPSLQHAELVKSDSAPASPTVENASYQESHVTMVRSESERHHGKGRPRSNSPIRPPSSRTGSTHGHVRGSHKVKRSGSGSSHSSMSDNWTNPRGSSSNLLAGVLPSTKWRFLKHLSLADNSLTSIPATSFAPLVNTLHSLDLSANLFTQIPDCLASLTALRALNLSNCMIDALHSLTRNPLPAITALNLRSNRLTSLAGIERLYPLERLDLRDNKLTDPTELARLTGIPDLREIWVAGNPFTKTHSNYRVTIFNLFRNSPGYTEDILIDAGGPGYSERRQLVDRVAERTNVPVVKPLHPEYVLPLADPFKPTITYGAAASKDVNVLKSEILTSATTQPELNRSTSRKKKASRRRIVDLSTNESPTKPKARFSTLDSTDDLMAEQTLARSVDPQSIGSLGGPLSPSKFLPLSEGPVLAVIPERPLPQKSQSQPDMPRIDTTVAPTSGKIESVYAPPSTKTPSRDATDWNVSGEIYRKKIEALRNEVGNGWLSVLSEEGWDASKNGTDFSPASTVKPSPTTPRTTSQPTIHSSGRTLGSEMGQEGREISLRVP